MPSTCVGFQAEHDLKGSQRCTITIDPCVHVLLLSVPRQAATTGHQHRMKGLRSSFWLGPAMNTIQIVPNVMCASLNFRR